MYRDENIGIMNGSAAVPHVIPDRVRSRGTIDMSFAHMAGATTLDRSFQSGCLRMRLPRRIDHGRPCAVLINTSGGIAEGDRLDQRIAWEKGTRAIVTTQAAEKVYRALDQGSTIRTTLTVADGADAEWLPQETILFDRARLTRDSQVNLGADASYLGVEAILLGRAAMDERICSGMLADSLRIIREGRLIYADRFHLDGAIESLIARRAIAHGAIAMAVILFVAAHAAALLEPAREALAQAGGLVAASCWNGVLAIRMLAPDSATLRRDLVTAMAVLRDGRPLPRVWSC